MTRLFFRDIDQPQARILSRRTALRIGMLFGPAVVVLIVLRLLEHTMLGAVGNPAVGNLLLGPAPPVLFILLMTGVLGWAATRAWPYVRPAWMTLGVVILGVGLVLWAVILVPPWLAGWLTLEAFQTVRGDLLVMLLLATVFAVLLDVSRGWTRRLCLVVLHVLVPLLVLLPIFEVSVIMTMGSPLDWSLLVYSIRHIGDLAPVLASEIGAAEVAMLVLPLVLTLAPLALLRIRTVWHWTLAMPVPDRRRAWQVVLVAVPLALVLLVPPQVALPPTHRTISYVGMARSMMEDSNWVPDDLAALTTPAALPFDTEALRFEPTDATRPLNVVVVILESFRSRSVTPYTPELETTPFLNRLARKGLLVEDMFAVVSYTNKSLVPMLAGVYPELSREIIEAEPGAVPAAGLPHLLKPHGYRTAFFTPATMLFENKDKILDNLGFDDIFGDEAYAKDGFHVTNYFGYEDRVMLAPSLDWVDAATAQGQPFLLSYLTLTSHHAYQIPPTFEERPFADEPELNAYLNALRYTDAFVKDLVDAFSRRGLLDSTLFIFIGDHGEAFGEHGQRLHGDVVWDEAMKIPALLYNPTLFPRGGRITGNRSQIDLMPTIADALGYEITGGSYPGTSLLDDVPADRAVYHSARNGNLALALRRDSLKFLYYNRRQPMQVFDVRNDPLERHDLAAEIDPDLMKQAELTLLLWRRGVQQVYHDHAAQTDHLAAR